MEVVNTIGRRKKAIARVYLSEGDGKIVVNKRDYKTFFPTAILHYVVEQPFQLTDTVGKFDIKANLDGGGTTGQAEALRLGIARALITVDPELRPILKEKGLLKRDPRMVERKKPGQPKARKKFQFSKR
ncbi:MAG: 30S ribosomal protein S9 [Bacteroidales bacterium]|nr:30S ribosomal protein S9 [Bacteroidales bacterium]MCF6341230.1 30S ribosomal protein S9 [Bacteroidales bacterium]